MCSSLISSVVSIKSAKSDLISYLHVCGSDEAAYDMTLCGCIFELQSLTTIWKYRSFGLVRSQMAKAGTVVTRIQSRFLCGYPLVWNTRYLDQKRQKSSDSFLILSSRLRLPHGLLVEVISR
jgi:hypothetical protein